MAKLTSIDGLPFLTIDQFLDYTGWEFDAIKKDRMRIALEFFQRTVPRNKLRLPDDSSPWAVPRDAKSCRLISYMQAIRFEDPLDGRHVIRRGTHLVGYSDWSTPQGGHFGNWYALGFTEAGRLAIYPGQTRRHDFVATTAIECLRSSVADAYAGWKADKPAYYRHGDAQQFFIWKPRRFLRAA